MKTLTSWLMIPLLVGLTSALSAQAESPKRSLHHLITDQSDSPELTVPTSSPSDDSPAVIAKNSRATVFAPPSNVRDRPNGNVVCTITSRREINVYRYSDNRYQWISTDACGSGTYGVIHVSQIRF